jgi:hypothetical protein
MVDGNWRWSLEREGTEDLCMISLDDLDKKLVITFLYTSPRSIYHHQRPIWVSLVYVSLAMLPPLLTTGRTLTIYCILISNKLYHWKTRATVSVSGSELTCRRHGAPA